MQKSIISVIIMLLLLLPAGCAPEKEIKKPDRFTKIIDGTITDNKTGLIWCDLEPQIKPVQCMNYKAAKNYVDKLNKSGHAGYKDWRFPTVNELFILYNTEPYFEDTVAEWYWSSEVVFKGKSEVAGIVKPDRSKVFKREYSDMKQCGAVRAVRP